MTFSIPFIQIWYEPLYFDEDVHISTVFNCTADSQRFLKELRLDFHVEMLHFDPGSEQQFSYGKFQKIVLQLR